MKYEKLKVLFATAMVFGASQTNAQNRNSVDLESLQLLEENGMSFEEFDQQMVGIERRSGGNYSAHGISSGNYSAHGISSGNYSAHGISSGNYSAHGISSGNYSAHGISSGSVMNMKAQPANIPSPEVMIESEEI